VVRSPRKTRNRREPYCAATVESGRVSSVKTTGGCQGRGGYIDQDTAHLIHTTSQDELAVLKHFVGMRISTHTLF